MSTDEQKADVAEKLDNLVQEFFIDLQVELANAEETGERIDLWPEEIDVPVQLLSEAAATITALQDRVRELEGEVKGLRDYKIKYEVWKQFYGALLAVPPESATPEKVRIHRQANLITDMQYRIRNLRREIRRHLQRDPLEKPFPSYSVGRHVSELHRLWRMDADRANAAEAHLSALKDSTNG